MSLEPVVFHEHIKNKDLCTGASDDYDFTTMLDDEVSSIHQMDKNMNLYSNKSLKTELMNPGPQRTKSLNRKDFQFGNLNKCPSNSFLRQSNNPSASCYNFDPNLNQTCHNPLTMSMNQPLCQSI